MSEKTVIVVFPTIFSLNKIDYLISNISKILKMKNQSYDRIQQNNLLGWPQITYFKTQFKRHTNFAMETVNTQSKIHVLHTQPKHLIKNKSPKIKKSYQIVSHYNNNQKYNKQIKIRNQRR